MRTYLPLQPPMLEPVRDSSYRYREFPPGKALEPYVACYWTVEFDASCDRKLHRIIPDGCADIIFDLHAPSFAQSAMLAGLMSSFETMDLTDRCYFFGIRFFADQASRFIGYSVAELSGGDVFLEDVWGTEASLVAERVQEAAGSVQAMIGLAESMLSAKLHRPACPDPQPIRTAMQHLYAGRGMVSVRALAEELCYSERTVRRMFQKEFGMAPKELASIIRFQCLLQELHKGPSFRFSDTAVQHGYYDQPHLIHMFKRFYGLTPHQVFR
ncbi:transcriptional activator FtrA [Paenibacillus sp. P1XP2]|nr:transcriptional activator FtrA [Paenibacillus sp. P1XP2]